jgi:dephospho-CoA kinase
MAKARCPVIGLAGGIGAGKSSVADAFLRLGAAVIDADEIAHEVLAWPDVVRRIEREFGPGIVAGGRVSRPALAAKVFSDKLLLDKLTSIIHPPVIAETRRVIDTARRAASCPAVVIDAPLLIEAGLKGLCDALVFVDAAPEIRAQRLAASKGWDPAEIERRQKFQDSLIYKRHQADYTIVNNGSLDDVARQAAEIWGKVVGS